MILLKLPEIKYTLEDADDFYIDYRSNLHKIYQHKYFFELDYLYRRLRVNHNKYRNADFSYALYVCSLLKVQ